MLITIKYGATWQNSFLDGSNNEPIPKKGRKFIGSMAKSKSNANLIKKKISHDTVMGILNRLIGDQRKLYQARQCQKYFFSEVERNHLVHFEILQSKSNKETIFIRNITGNADQNLFTGMIKNNDPIFNSNYSNELWGVLTLDFEKLCQFIIDPDYSIVNRKQFSPLSIGELFEGLKKLKASEVPDYVKKALNTLQDKKFPNSKYLDEGKIKPVAFYCSALYLQIDRLRRRFDLSSALTKDHKLSGISINSFTMKDFMKRFTTGGKKHVWGNPYSLTKTSGVLEIRIDIPREKAVQLKEMIEAAGVSSFYLGKKGLAYVSEICI